MKISEDVINRIAVEIVDDVKNYINEHEADFEDFVFLMKKEDDDE